MTDLPTPGPRPASRSIAAIIPLHNGASTIAAAIHSIRVQTIAPDEILVVDDGSEDEGPAIVERLGAPRVTLIRQANAGQSAARNRGAAPSTGTLLAFLDQDDAWHPHHLRTVSRYLEGGSRLAVAGFSLVAPGMMAARAARALYRRLGRTPFRHS